MPKKGNKIFFFLFVLMLLLYMVSQFYKPKQFDWNITLQNDDKNPFGTYLLFQQLPDLFKGAEIENIREPIYNNFEKIVPGFTAYILIENNLDLGDADRDKLFSYVEKGNFAFISTSANNAISDSLGLHLSSSESFFPTDSTAINFVNPSLRSTKDYTFLKGTIGHIFDSIKKPESVTVLGTNQKAQPDFIKIKFGDGYFFWHAAPVCFTNYFLLKNTNYVSKAMSYIPGTVNTVYWDEYYKSGRAGPATPLRFFLSNEYLKYALYLSVIALILYVLFEIKRKQRIIPIIEPAKNESLNFVETIAGVYFSQHDNKAIAQKKSSFWSDFVRRKYKLSHTGNKEFKILLEKRSGVPEELIEEILYHIKRAKAQPVVTDDLLLALSNSLDKFYEITKSLIHGNKE